MNLWIELLVMVLLASFKAMRDIIAFRYHRSIFSLLPEKVINFLLDSKNIRNSHDGWHLFDMLLLMGFLYIGQQNIWLILLDFVVFYVAFDTFFHILFIRKGYRENWVSLEYNRTMLSLKRWFS